MSSLSSSGCFGAIRRKFAEGTLPWKRTLLVLALVVLCWPYLSFYLSIAYTYASWIFLPDISWARPPSAPTDPQAKFPVPKLLHQTWKTSELPERWRGPQQSCIAAHRDYEYKLWTGTSLLRGGC